MSNNQFEGLSKRYQEEMMKLYNRRLANNSPKYPKNQSNKANNKPIIEQPITAEETPTKEVIKPIEQQAENNISNRLPTAPPPKSLSPDYNAKPTMTQPQNNNTPITNNTSSPTQQPSIEEKYPTPILPYFIYEQPQPIYPSDKDTATGYLKVEVSVANKAIPIEGATVIISQPRSNKNSTIINVLETNQNGETQTVPLSAPPIEFSETPDNPRPFSTYNISIYKAGFFETQNLNVPVFADTTSIQPVNMIPLPSIQENETPSLILPSVPPDL